MLYNQLHDQLTQLTTLLQKLTIKQYTYKSKYLANATIGEHTRHIIEMLQCAVNGYKTNEINYTNRVRNLSIETDVNLAISLILSLQQNTKQIDKQLCIINEADYTFTTSYYRELMYNVEHIVHHFALIKVSLIELDINIVSENFGIAYATIQYKKSLQKV